MSLTVVFYSFLIPTLLLALVGVPRHAIAVYLTLLLGVLALTGAIT